MGSKTVENRSLTVRLHQRIGALSPWIILLLLFCANTAFRTVLANFPKCIAIYNEEQWYYLLAENLAKGRGFPSVYYGHYSIWRVVYSILIAPAFLTANRDVQFFLIGFINSAILSSGIFPAYCLAKEYLSEKRHIYLIVVLYLLMPDMNYNITFACDQPFLVICLWAIFFACRVLTNESGSRKTRIRDIAFLIVLCVIGLFTKRAMIIFGIAFLILEILFALIQWKKNRFKTNLFIFLGLAVFAVLGIWLMSRYGFLQYITQFTDSSQLYLDADLFYFFSLFLFMILSDAVALLFFPFFLPYLSIAALKKKHRILLALMSILTVTFAFLSVSVAFYRVTPYEVFLRYVPFLWIPYLVLFLASMESVPAERETRSRRLAIGLGILAVAAGVLYRGMGFWSNVDQTMLFWTLHWTDQRVLYAACFIAVCLVMCIILYKDRSLFFKIFFGIWIIIQLYNNVVAYQRYRAEWGFSGTDIREIEEFVRQHPEDTFCILDNDYYSDGRYDFSEARMADTFLNYPNVIRSSLVSVLQAENAVKSAEKELDLSDYQFPVYCWMSDELYYPSRNVDYLFVPRNATCTVDSSGAELCDIGNGDWFEIYKLKDPSILPEIHSAKYYDCFPKEEMTFDVALGNFGSNYKEDSSKQRKTHTSTEEQNYLLFGPYGTLPSGEYEITVHYSYEGDDDGRIGYMDLNGSSIDPADKETIAYSDRNTASITLGLDEQCDSFEVRLFAEKPGVRVESVDIDLIALTAQIERPGYLIHQLLNTDHTVKQEEYYSSDNEAVNNTSGYHTVKYSYQNGNRVKSSFFDIEGEPVITTSGYAVLRSFYNESGYLVREEYYGLDEKPISVQGYYAAEYERDVNGDAVEIRYYDENDKRFTLSVGYAVIRRTYNEEKRITREEYLDPEYEPVMRTDGYSAVEYSYDEYGNLIEYRYYDLDGELTQMSSGYAINRREFNEEKQVIRDIYLDGAGKPVIRTGGYSAVEYSYDEADNITEYRYYDQEDVLTLTDSGYSILKRKFNQQKQVIREEYYNRENEPAVRPEGYSAVEYAYDDVNNLIEYRYYNSDGELTPVSSGYAILRKDFNEARKPIREEYYDSKDNFVMRSEGYGAVEYAYDRVGNTIEYSYYDLEGKLIQLSSGYAILRREYNKARQITKDKYYDAQAERTVRSEGYGAIEYAYDKAGNTIEYRYCDLDGKPILLSSGYAILRREYNERKQVIRESFFDKEDLPALRTDGYSSVEYSRDARGHAVEEWYYGLDGKMADNSSGYAHITRIYDQDGTLSEEKRYHADGTVVE